MRWLLLLVAVTGSACTSDQRLVAAAAAAQTYAEAHYEWECVEKVGPPTCKADQTAVDAAKREVTLDNRVYKIGKLPKVARERLKAIAKALPK